MTNLALLAIPVLPVKWKAPYTSYPFWGANISLVFFSFSVLENLE